MRNSGWNDLFNWTLGFHRDLSCVENPLTYLDKKNIDFKSLYCETQIYINIRIDCVWVFVWLLPFILCQYVRFMLAEKFHRHMIDYNISLTNEISEELTCFFINLSSVNLNKKFFTFSDKQDKLWLMIQIKE